MSAQFAEQPADPRVAAIPRTIGAIRDAMPDETRRREFLLKVLAAELGPELDEVVSAAWYDLMLDRSPGHEEREERLADALRGDNQVELPALRLVDGV
jgi:hypothetical protein